MSLKFKIMGNYKYRLLKSEGFKNLKKGDKLVLEMPSFCSGDYTLIVKKDEDGLYVTERWLDGCRDFTVYRKGKIVKI